MAMTTMTHFQLVGEFHDTFEHPQRTVLYTNCFDEKPDLVPFRIGLMQEELNEFVSLGLCKANPLEMADALCDLSYVTNGAGHCLGINLDESMRKYGVNISTVGTYGGSGYVDSHIISNNADMITTQLGALYKALYNFCSSADSRDLAKMEFYLVEMLKEVYDFGHGLGFHMDNMFREVHRANMTKKCANIEEAEYSVKFYLEEGRYKTPAYKPKDNYFVMYDVQSTKILKNQKWDEPNLQQFF